MKEPKDTLQPETIDHVIETHAFSQDRQTNRLIQQLHASAHQYTQENEQSLDRIWSRIVQSQEHSFPLQQAWRPPEEKVLPMKERNTREEDSVPWATNYPTTPVQLKKRSSFLRVASIGLIAAVAIIMIVSFTIFSGVLRSAPQTINKQTTGTGSQKQQQQKVITGGKQVCSLSAGPQGSMQGTSGSADLAWSSQGLLAVATSQEIKVYATKNCATTSFSQPQLQQANGPVWSPDGNKLFVSSGSAGSNAYILDSTGKIITRLSFPAGVNSRVWSPDNTLVINSLDAHDENNIKENINIVDVNNGNKVTTTLLPEGVVVGFSANGKLALVQHFSKNNLTIWDINAEKQAGNASFPIATSDAQLSPDGSLLALDNEGKIKIYSTTDGKQLASFEHKVTGYNTRTLAWSPDGKYLAEGADVITIYDVAAKKLATTLGTSSDQDRITNLAWSPDGAGIASATKATSNDQPSDLTINVWALS
jgi:hypothetical protein